MRQIRIEKISLNLGAGKDQDKIKKGIKLFSNLTHKTPVKTVTNKRIPGWGLRPGLPVGCRLTIRGGQAKELLPRLLDAKAFTLVESQFDENGSISFGIPEYIDIKGAKYDPEIGVIGLEVSITLQRPGFRIKRRRLYTRKIPPKARITKQEAMDFMKQEYKVTVEESS